MIRITPKEHVISEEEKAELFGELNHDFLIEKIINDGKNNLADFETNFLIKEISEQKDIPSSEVNILEYVKEKRNLYFRKLCNEKINSGFYSNALGEAHFYSFNAEDQANFTMQLSFLNVKETITEILWKTEDKGVKSHTKEQFLKVCEDGEIHKREKIANYWNIKSKIEVSNSFEELLTIHW